MALSLLMAVVPYCLNAAPRLASSASHETVMSSIASVTIHEGEYGTIVKILADGKVPECTIDFMDSPARIIVDIPVAVNSFDSMIIPGRGSSVKDIRVGHHPGRIRVVLDPRFKRVRLLIIAMQGYNPAPGALDGAIRHRWPGVIVGNTDRFDLRGEPLVSPTTAHQLGLVPDRKLFITRQRICCYQYSCITRIFTHGDGGLSTRLSDACRS